MIFFASVLTLPIAEAFSQEGGEAWHLPPVITEGTPADVLQADPVLPTREGRTSQTSGSGSVQRAVSNGIALPIDDQAQPGTKASFRGLGRSVEDTDVQALGIPLNYPQGGGFDLASFPQYVWSNYRFQLGPSLSAFDPRGISGTLVLVPWTQEALTTRGSGARLMSFYSDAGVTQVSVAGKFQDQIAAVAGLSSGDVEGPGGSLSGRWAWGSKLSGKYHLLGAYQNALIPGTRSFATPRTRQISARLIPVFQTDWAVSDSALLKSSFYYDRVYLKFDSPEQSVFTRDRIAQFGTENALLWEEWKFGLSVRRVETVHIGFSPPSETLGQIQLSRAIESGRLLVEPTFQAVGVTRFGVHPAGSLGAKLQFSEPHSVFSRLSYSRRFPSLVDRFYVYPGAGLTNPALQPERAWTAILGTQWREKSWDTSFQAFAQLREDALLSVQLAPGSASQPFGLSQVQNTRSAWIGSLLHHLAFRPMSWLEMSSGLTYSQSRVLSTGYPFPYQPSWVHLFNVVLRHGAWDPAWQTGLTLRSATDATANASQWVRGYSYLDLKARARLLRRRGNQTLELAGGVENLLDRPIEFVPDYPSPGRVISIALIGQF